MNAELTSEEQALSIVKRWQKESHLTFWILMIIVSLIFPAILLSLPKKFAALFFLLPFIAFGVTIGTAVVVGKRFARKLSAEERRLVLSAKSPNKDLYAYDQLIFACKIDMQKELLRASAPTADDGTLLRAAAYNDKTPKEELLRASNTGQP